MGLPRKRLEQAKTVATGCDQLPIGAHGKEGVDGSSPSEGSQKSPAHAGLLLLNVTAFLPTCSAMEQFLEQPDEKGRDFVVSIGNEGPPAQRLTECAAPNARAEVAGRRPIRDNPGESQ
jgi:hypothetical protein